jgi:hypothetical protein
MISKEEIINKLKNNIPLLALFLISTIFLLVQHYFLIDWDFKAYVLNAKYLFYGGNYFEVYRAPLTPLLLGILIIFGKIGEYFYITLVSLIFFTSVILLGEKLADEIIQNKKDKKSFIVIFYFCLLSPFVLKYATLIGTEMLGLGLFNLFIYSLLSKKISGQYLGLATLARYNFLIFTPLLFFSKSIKKIIYNLITFCIILSPWLIFNYLKFGNPLVSLIDSFALNVYNRGYLFQQMTLTNFTPLFSWFLPFFIIGFCLFFIELIKEKKMKKIKNQKDNFKIGGMMLLISFLIILDFQNTPLKFSRYLFNLALPIAFFSAIGIYNLKKITKIKENHLYILLIILLIITTIPLLKISYETSEEILFKQVSEDIIRLNILNCEIISPIWVPVTYYVENVYPLKGTKLSDEIENKRIILIFKKFTTIDDRFTLEEIKEYPTLYETEDYVFLAKEDISEDCSPKYTYNPPYTENHCQILSSKFKKLKLDNLSFKICQKITR